MQNDILKEYVARGNYIFPPRPSMRLTTDLFAYCEERIPRWNTISISGYHIREAGSTAAQELAFTLANGIAYCEAAVAAGLSPDAFGARLSFFFNAHNDFFQEVAKFRAARPLWAQIMRERFGATNPRAQALRFHAQTGGLHAHRPAAGEQHRPRRHPGALRRLRRRAVAPHEQLRRGARAPDASTPPRSRCARSRSSRHEAGTTDTADPLGGSYDVEALTTELEERAWELIERIDELGGAVAAIEDGFVQGEIEEAAFASRTTSSGVSASSSASTSFTQDGEARRAPAGRPRDERRQRERTARVRAERDAEAAARALADVRTRRRGHR